jgi:hypothetical protein
LGDFDSLSFWPEREAASTGKERENGGWFGKGRGLPSIWERTKGKGERRPLSRKVRGYLVCFQGQGDGGSLFFGNGWGHRFSFVFFARELKREDEQRPFERVRFRVFFFCFPLFFAVLRFPNFFSSPSSIPL